MKPVRCQPVAPQSQLQIPNVTEEDPEMVPTEEKQQDDKKDAVLEEEDNNAKTAVTELMSGSDEDFDWQETLGNCPEEAVKKMLENTTQFFPNRVEAEVWAYPTQH
eukprot:14654882-Ditylum_brightwellii.AAC.1